MARRVRQRAPFIPVGIASPPGAFVITRFESAKHWSESGDWAWVNSSNVLAIRYIKEHEELLIMFTSGRIYRYDKVGMSPWLGGIYNAEYMYDCNSMGRFVWQKIRDRGINGTRIK